MPGGEGGGGEVAQAGGEEVEVEDCDLGPGGEGGS